GGSVGERRRCGRTGAAGRAGPAAGPRRVEAGGRDGAETRCAAGARDAARRPQRSVSVRERQEVQEVPHAGRRARGDGRLSVHDEAGAGRLLRLLARKLEEYLDGDELALETLA